MFVFDILMLPLDYMLVVFYIREIDVILIG